MEQTGEHIFLNYPYISFGGVDCHLVATIARVVVAGRTKHTFAYDLKIYTA